MPKAKKVLKREVARLIKATPSTEAIRDEGPRLLPLPEKRIGLESYSRKYLDLADIALGSTNSKIAKKTKKHSA